MGLVSGLTLYCYNLALPQPYVAAYDHALENLEFTTVAPGGFGDLKATVKLKDARLPHPELAMFSRVALVGHGHNAQARCVWLGEIMDAPTVLDATNGEVVEISALGIGNCLRDDPQSFAYSGKTAKQVAVDQLTGATTGSPVTWRANAWPLDQDTSLLFPDNPATTYGLSYTNRNGEEILADVCTLAGSSTASYLWGTQAHGRNVDVAGFPTGQLYAKLQDTNTTAYLASLLQRDVTAYRIGGTSDRAYNVVKITYNDPSGTGVGTATATDARLGASGAQGTAPFRRRVYLRALEGVVTVTAAQAQQIANQILAQYQNISNKVELRLGRVRNPQGIETPLWEVAAGPAGNIYVPELAVRGSQLAMQATAGVNQFFIVSTSYREGSFADTGDTYTMDLQLECDNYIDSTATQIARLQLVADALSRVQRDTQATTALGASVKGFYSIVSQASAGGQVVGGPVNYGTTLSQSPTSITLTPAVTTNCGSPSSSNVGTLGFTVFVTSSAGGKVESSGTFLTNGN